MAGRRLSSKDAIVKAAADLIHRRGVAGTSVDDILKASGTGKSQFYYYFESKDELIHAVLRFQVERYISAQQPFIENLSSWKGIADWLAALVDEHESRKLMGGCPLGSLAAEMADRDERLRRELADAFDRWESYLARGLQVLKDRGSLAARADVDGLAETVMTAIQGGYLLATTKKDARPMRNGTSAAYSYLRSFRPSSRS